MTENSLLNVAVIGLGVGEQHARTYANEGTCHLKWLHDLDRDRAETLANQLEATDIAENEDEIFDDDEVDIVSIASYDDDHCDQVIKGLKAKKNLFVEKPLCRTIDELKRIKVAWVEAGEPVLETNLVLRSAPLYLWLKAEISAGTFGDIYAIDGDYLYGRLHKITEGWRKEVDNYSVMSGGGIHMIDLMVWLTDSYPSSVSSVGNRISTEGSAFAFNDFMASTFRFPSGMNGRISANFGCVHRHHHVLRVFGTKATFIYDDRGARIHTTRDGNTHAKTLNIQPLPSTKGALISNFIENVQQNKHASNQVRAAVQHNIDVVSVVAAADIAVNSNQEEAIIYV